MLEGVEIIRVEELEMDKEGEKVSSVCMCSIFWGQLCISLHNKYIPLLWRREG